MGTFETQELFAFAFDSALERNPRKIEQEKQKLLYEIIVMKLSVMTPLRRLNGISYWVIEDPDGIYDFINSEIRKEWEADARSERRDPSEDAWLQALSKYRWRLEALDLGRIKVDPRMIDYVDFKTGYNFAESLAKRSEELRRTVEEYGSVIWPIVVIEKNMQLVDGYCRYVTLKAMNIPRTYAYVGSYVEAL